MSEAVIVVENLTRRFGEFVAVDHINFEIEAGEVVGYLGPNGSGKTTTIRMLLGLLQPSDGKATVLGYDAFKQSEEVRTRAGYMSQKFALYDELTVWENLTFYGGVYGISEKSRIRATLELVGLTGHDSAQARSLSAGWRQRLALAIALVHQPKLLFLDEPTSGVDPTARRCLLGFDLSTGGKRRDDHGHHALYGRSRILPARGHHARWKIIGDGYAVELEIESHFRRRVGSLCRAFAKWTRRIAWCSWRVACWFDRRSYSHHHRTRHSSGGIAKCTRCQGCDRA